MFAFSRCEGNLIAKQILQMLLHVVSIPIVGKSKGLIEIIFGLTGI